MYRYYISFVHLPAVRPSFGTIELKFPRRIRSLADVNSIGERLVHNEGLNNVTILSFSAFADDENGANS